jgi:hypothetical protein
MSPKIEFLTQVNVREAWSNEALDFTPWIATKEIAERLLAQCEIDFDGDLTVQKEVAVPGVKRKLDVLIETSSGERIAVENQFSTLDHDHMTRALAYAVGLEAKAVIIIAESHRPEFVAVAEYLNAAALAYQEKGIPIFLVALELHASSAQNVYYPRFEVVAQPNEWRAAVFQNSHNPGAETSLSIALFNFHDQMLPDIRTATGIFRNVKPSSNNWKAGSFGMSSVQIGYKVAKDVTTVSIWVHSRSKESNSRGLAVLKANDLEIRKRLGSAEFVYREQETSSIDVSVSGIGWGAGEEKARAELLRVLRELTEIAKQSEIELRQALAAVE